MYLKWTFYFTLVSLAVLVCSHSLLSFTESKNEQIERYIAQASRKYDPLGVEYLKLVELSESLSDAQALSLRKQGYPHFAIEWAIRLIKQQQYEQAWLLIKQYWPSAGKPIQVRLLKQLDLQNHYQLISNIFADYPTIEPYYTTAQLAQGVDPDKLSTEVLSQINVVTLDMLHGKQNDCAHQIILLGDTLKSTLQLTHIKAKYQKSALAKQLPYCLSDPIYVGKSVACTGSEKAFIRCNLAKVAHAKSLAEARHVVVMTELPGLANVRHGIMSLNSSHEFELFVHELMHFSYFEDEYPIPQEKAKWLCAAPGLKAPNLYVGEHPPQDWYPSKTCMHGKLPSYKPSHTLSKMEYHAINLSNQYLGLWLKALEQSLMAPSDFQVYHHKLVNAYPALVK
ncbi:hypothetical protein L1286_10135 [Pseudoalteromonas sp. SMS1]|uniref:hypothetical protein n=1 Tax=Pseudoalteromonas sp. SMS1 TaxID=2908894 RepID=UPI001F15F4BF|nr:hypothetical protein [Pseudoalteromonas sp. SMS1]MCF2857831.1 hypothetical protein [Pseudoalteromonas sp. SMS1]